jgi:excisionase family DNA binding protein
VSGLERLLTARELAELLGFSAATVVDWSERGEVPSFKIGGRLRFRESEVADWLEERRQGRGEELAPTSTTLARVVAYASPTSTNRGGNDGT